MPVAQRSREITRKGRETVAVGDFSPAENSPRAPPVHRSTNPGARNRPRGRRGAGLAGPGPRPLSGRSPRAIDIRERLRLGGPSRVIRVATCRVYTHSQPSVSSNSPNCALGRQCARGGHTGTDTAAGPALATAHSLFSAGFSSRRRVYPAGGHVELVRRRLGGRRVGAELERGRDARPVPHRLLGRVVQPVDSGEVGPRLEVGEALRLRVVPPRVGRGVRLERLLRRREGALACGGRASKGASRASPLSPAAGISSAPSTE